MMSPVMKVREGSYLRCCLPDASLHKESLAKETATCETVPTSPCVAYGYKWCNLHHVIINFSG